MASFINGTPGVLIFLEQFRNPFHFLLGSFLLEVPMRGGMAFLKALVWAIRY